MNEKVTLLRIKKDYSTKLELAKDIVEIVTVLKKVSISNTAKMILAYFMVYGINNETKQLILKSKLCKNNDVLKCLMTVLRKNNLIYKDELNSKNYVCDELKLNVTDIMAINIKMNIE